MLVGLPMALVIALTPFAVVPAIVLLLTPRPRATAGAFLAGWAAGVAAVTAVAIAAADLVDATGTAPGWTAWVRLLLGVALVALGIGRWHTRRQAGGAPGWLQGVQSATPRHAFALGLLMSAANPKVLVLALAGGVAIGAASTRLWPELLGLLAFTAVASLGVALPWLAFIAFGARAVRVLTRLRAWLEAHAAAMIAIVLMVLGVALVASGWAKL